MLLSLSLLFVQCNTKSCKDTDCHNGGSSYKNTGGECACNCAQGYSGIYCDARANFMTCKVNGVPYKSFTMHTDVNQNGYRIISGFTNSDTADVVVLTFLNNLSTGTYNNLNFDFWGGYRKDKSTLYESGKASLNLTNVNQRYEGSFSFKATLLSNLNDSVLVTDGVFVMNK